jgi:L-lactate dehydrogenase complex protein LldG
VSGGAGARDEIMRRIQGALGPGVAVPEIPRRYRGPRIDDSSVDRFCERVVEYRASVTRIGAADLADTVARLCRERGARRIAVPRGGPEALDGVEVVVDDPPLSPQALDELDGVLTGCALAIAETGTIVLDGGERSGRRALTLVPDWHVCIVEAGSVVAGVPDAVAALAEAAGEGRPITLVSGPSATSDIELDRVEGVHGPRTLDVLLLEG